MHLACPLTKSIAISALAVAFQHHDHNVQALQTQPSTAAPRAPPREQSLLLHAWWPSAMRERLRRRKMPAVRLKGRLQPGSRHGSDEPPQYLSTPMACRSTAPAAGPRSPSKPKCKLIQTARTQQPSVLNVRVAHRQVIARCA